MTHGGVCRSSVQYGQEQASCGQHSRIPQLPASSAQAFETRLNEFKAENSLLGRLLQDSQTHAKQLEDKLKTAQRKQADATRQQFDLRKQNDAGVCLFMSLACVLCVCTVHAAAHLAIGCNHCSQALWCWALAIGCSVVGWCDTMI